MPRTVPAALILSQYLAEGARIAAHDIFTDPPFCRGSCASADAAMTYLQFALEDQKKADLYLKLFCKKNDIAMQYVQRWLPIVAAAQMTKKHGAEKEFLTGWTQVVEFE